ncbi:MAG TPA: hypothetical protein P5205_12040 [Candidatus Paceibacterota bacterium]|nr:hypothetical protein [Candidatus Paceibacterota bacterium]
MKAKVGQRRFYPSVVTPKTLNFPPSPKTLPAQMAQPPPAVLDLVQRFDRNRDAYKSPHYNETQLRREFLDPLFKSLGWDVDNEQGYAEAYKDVTRAALGTCGRAKNDCLSGSVQRARFGGMCGSVRVGCGGARQPAAKP